MTRLIAALVVTLSLLSGAAKAQTWVQVQALPTLAQAEDRARAFASIFPDVAGFRLRSGWYAIAIGPYARDEAGRRLAALKAEAMIPADSYLTDGSTYGDRFWPVAAGAVPPLPEGGEEIAVTPLPDPAPGPMPGPAPEPAPDPLPAALPDETPAQARRSEALLSREEKQELQTALKFEGFYDSAIDGAYGPGTRSAMAAWQSARGHEPTGVLTTGQRQELLAAYHAVLDSIGLAEVRDNTAGIAVRMPMALVQKGDYQPPFAHYGAKDGSGVRVILISQRGDAATLFGLYDILQTLEVVPLDGPRERQERSFVIDGRNAELVTHAEARLTGDGAVKGFILIWPLNDEKRRQVVLAAMQESFQPLPDAVLPDSAGDGGAQDIDLLSGLEIRRPDLSRTGFYVDARGRVLTTADAAAGCQRLTLDGGVAARVLAADPALGVALLEAEAPLAPLGHARLAAAMPRLGSEIAVSGYAYDGRLGAPVVTFGRLTDVKGLDGSPDLRRLELATTSGEAGAPVLDGSGAVLGLLLPPPSGGRVLPDTVAFALGAERLAGWLAGQGIATEAAAAGGDIPPEALTDLARDMSVQVSCWN